MTDLDRPAHAVATPERARRWRLALGAAADDAAGGDAARPALFALDDRDAKADGALAKLYESERRGGLGGSRPDIARWLGDIRECFPSTVVQVIQHDAIERLGLRQLLAEPELLNSLEPDVGLVTDLLALGSLLPDAARETARSIVRRVVSELERKLARRLVPAVIGALDRSRRTRRPRQAADIDWDRTIRANLDRYQPETGTIVPERLIANARRRRGGRLRDVVIALDQSGSMAPSLVHGAVCASVLAGVRSVRTSLLVFDTQVVDLTELLPDPVEVLFGTQLGGGTDIAGCVAHIEILVERPSDTLIVIVTDCFEGGDQEALLDRLGRLHHAGATVIVLLALGDGGAPAHDGEVAGAIASLGIATFACTPDAFADMVACAIERGDVAAWADRAGFVVTRSGE